MNTLNWFDGVLVTLFVGLILLMVSDDARPVRPMTGADRCFWVIFGLLLITGVMFA